MGLWLGMATTLAFCVSASPQTPPTPASEPSRAASVSAPSDLDLARSAMKLGKLPLAWAHLERQLDRSPDDGDALALLSKCVRTMAAEDCGRGDHMEAGASLSRLAARLQTARIARFQPDAAVTPLDDLVARDRDVQQIGDSITASADEQAKPRIDAAMRLADEAHRHWYTFRCNDRNKVREALRELRWVHDRGPMVSAATNGRYYEAIDQLKALVAVSEWEPLLAEAGYAHNTGAR